MFPAVLFLSDLAKIAQIVGSIQTPGRDLQCEHQPEDHRPRDCLVVCVGVFSTFQRHMINPTIRLALDYSSSTAWKFPRLAPCRKSVISHNSCQHSFRRSKLLWHLEPTGKTWVKTQIGRQQRQSKDAELRGEINEDEVSVGFGALLFSPYF